MRRIHVALIRNPLAGAFVAWTCSDYLVLAPVFRSFTWSVLFATLTPFALMQASLIALRKTQRNTLRADAAIVIDSIVALAALLAVLNVSLVFVRPLLFIVVFAAWCVCVPATFWTIVDAIGLSRSVDFAHRRRDRFAGYLLAIVVGFAAALPFGLGLRMRLSYLETALHLDFINDNTRAILLSAPYLAVFLGLFSASGGLRQIFLLKAAFCLALYSILLAAICAYQPIPLFDEDFNARPIESLPRVLAIALFLPWCFLPLWFMTWSFDWLDLIYAPHGDAGASASGGDPTRRVVSSGR